MHESVRWSNPTLRPWHGALLALLVAGGCGSEPSGADGAAAPAPAAETAVADPAVPAATPPDPATTVATADGMPEAEQPWTHCRFGGAPDWVGPPPVLEMRCSEFDTAMEACTDFRLRFANGTAVDAAGLAVPAADGVLAFNPVGVNFLEETIGGDGFGRWQLYVAEPGGGRVAEERWAIFDADGKAVSALLDRAALDAWTAERHQPDQGLWLEEPVMLERTCAPAE